MGTTVDITGELAAMEKMTAGQLREVCRNLVGEKPRSGNRRRLFRRCAWRLQALVALPHTAPSPWPKCPPKVHIRNHFISSPENLFLPARAHRMIG